MNTAPRSPMEAARRQRETRACIAMAIVLALCALASLAVAFYVTRGTVDDERIRPTMDQSQ